MVRPSFCAAGGSRLDDWEVLRGDLNARADWVDDSAAWFVMVLGVIE